jgi:putative membrane protein
MADLGLAIAHHILVFGLVTMLAVQAALVRPGMSPKDVLRVARMDMGYGATAGLILVVGGLRIVYGLKGPDYYMSNVWFWAKLASFVVAGFLSVPPTLRFRAWLGARKANPYFVPSGAEIAQVATYVRFEFLLLVAVLVFAASMARYAGI